MASIDEKVQLFQTVLCHFNSSKAAELSGVADLLTCARHWCMAHAHIDFDDRVRASLKRYLEDRAPDKAKSEKPAEPDSQPPTNADRALRFDEVVTAQVERTSAPSKLAAAIVMLEDMECWIRKGGHDFAAIARACHARVEEAERKVVERELGGDEFNPVAVFHALMASPDRMDLVRSRHIQRLEVRLVPLVEAFKRLEDECNPTVETYDGRRVPLGAVMAVGSAWDTGVFLRFTLHLADSRHPVDVRVAPTGKSFRVRASINDKPDGEAAYDDWKDAYRYMLERIIPWICSWNAKPAICK